MIYNVICVKLPSSDIDLLVSSDIKGLKFFGLVEELRQELHKKVDVLDISQLTNKIGRAHV